MMRISDTKNTKIFVSNSSEETEAIGKRIAQETKPPAFLALYGDLGSGKTTFIKGFARGLGIKGRIISPTFIIMRSYSLKPGGTRNDKHFFHIDLYRIKKAEDLEGLGMREIIKNKNNIIAVEWAEKMQELLPKKRTDIYFEYQDNDSRKITIQYPGA